MAFLTKDRVRETTMTTGTGSISLAGAVTGYQAFSSLGDGTTTYYCVAGVTTSEWEVGIGTYATATNTLARTAVLASSNSGSLVSFSTGAKDVFVTYPAGVPASYIAFPNASVNVSSVNGFGATASVDLALVPKGSGGLLAQVPDNTVSGGNKRGLRTVDFQLGRSASTQVASALASSILSGYGNTSSGLYSTVAGGYSNTASGIYSSVLAGTTNSAPGDYSVVVGGQQNAGLSSGTHTVILGGYLNRTYGNYSVVVGGQSNNATVTGAAIVGGSNNAANGVYSFVSGGVYGTTRGITGMHVFPACNAPIASAAGVSQAGLLILGVQTTNATPTVLRSNSAAATTSNQLILSNNSAVLVTINMLAWDQTSWYTVTRQGVITRGASAATVVYTDVGSSTSSRSLDGGAATWAISQAADTTNGGLAVTVTGQAGKTIRWVCKLETTEVAY